MIYLFTYNRIHCTEHGFYDTVTEKFYGVILGQDELSTTYYAIGDNEDAIYYKPFKYKLPDILNIIEINVVSYRKKYFDIELEKLIFDKL